jgi:hypothetical protein
MSNAQHLCYSSFYRLPPIPVFFRGPGISQAAPKIRNKMPQTPTNGFKH